MPWLIKKDNDRYCVHKENPDGSAGELVDCHLTEGEAKEHQRALYANVEDAAAKYFEMLAVKAVGDWEIDITALPYSSLDSDGQWFDTRTDTMADSFPLPAIFYHHGVKPGSKGIDDKPVVIGKATSIEKRADGLHVRAILDKANEYARRVWIAIKNGLAAVSSDSITHLARMDVNGKRVMWEKDKPGRIAVWPLAGVSLWDMVEGNFRPASRKAIALPAMKAIYREAGLPFPVLDDTTGAAQAETMARRRAEIIEKSNKLLLKLKSKGKIS
jgi:hypothetical protein